MYRGSSQIGRPSTLQMVKRGGSGIAIGVDAEQQEEIEVGWQMTRACYRPGFVMSVRRKDVSAA